MYNTNAKHKKSPQQLWKLETDSLFKKSYGHEELKARNDKVREMLRNAKPGKMNAKITQDENS
jgi:hypothetical protein